MKYAYAAVALAALVRAQGLESIPECAVPCLEKAISDNTDCDATDLACVCESFDAVRGDATSCVLSECDSDTAINEVLPAAQALCENPPTSGDGDDAGGDGDDAGGDGDDAEETPIEEDEPGVTPVPLPEPEEDPMPSMTTPSPETPHESDVVEPPTDGEPTPVPTAGAAAVGSMGGLAMMVLGAIAL